MPVTTPTCGAGPGETGDPRWSRPRPPWRLLSPGQWQVSGDWTLSAAHNMDGGSRTWLYRDIYCWCKIIINVWPETFLLSCVVPVSGLPCVQETDSGHRAKTHSLEPLNRFPEFLGQIWKPWILNFLDCFQQRFLEITTGAEFEYWEEGHLSQSQTLNIDFYTSCLTTERNWKWF